MKSLLPPNVIHKQIPFYFDCEDVCYSVVLQTVKHESIGAKMNKIYLFTTVFFFCFFNVCEAKTINILSGEYFPPYAFKTNDSGIDNQIVIKAFASENIQVHLEKVPLARVRISYAKDDIQCSSTTQPSANYKGYFSNVYVTYNNVAATLKSNPLPLKTMNDLSPYSILAFQEAKIYLGKNFETLVESFPNYHEINNQRDQVLALVHGKYHVIISDINVIYYWYNDINTLEKKLDKDAKNDFNIYPLFVRTDYQVVCKDESLIKAFNKGLEKIKKSGVYDEIYKSAKLEMPGK